MNARSNDETKPLINASVFIQIDEAENQSKIFHKDTPQDVMNQIVKHLPEKKYSPLARLSQTSKIMKKLIENTEAGKKAHQANEMKPNERTLRIDPDTITCTFFLVFLVSCFAAYCGVGIARVAGALPKKTGSQALDFILDTVLLGLVILTVLSCAVSCSLYAGLKFFSDNVKDKNDQAKQLRAEIDEQYRYRLRNGTTRF